MRCSHFNIALIIFLKTLITLVDCYYGQMEYYYKSYLKYLLVNFYNDGQSQAIMENQFKKMFAWELNHTIGSSLYLLHTS